MHRQAPVANKLVTAAWDAENSRKHRQRLSEAKTNIDNRPPKIYVHLINRSKKEQQLEERYDKIERENRLLLDKMSWIMRNPSLDNRNIAQPKSLNAVARKQTLRKIMDENQQILRRIQERKPFYDRRIWEDHSKNHATYLNNMREKTMLVEAVPEPVPRTQSAPLPLAATKRRKLVFRRKPDPGTVLTPLQLEHKRSPRQQGNTHGQLHKSSKAFLTQGEDDEHKQISQGGAHIDGQYVVVTVDEQLKPDHALVFRTYDLETSSDDRVAISFPDIKRLLKPNFTDLLTPERRHELASAFLRRLRFREGKLAVDLESEFTLPPETAGEELRAQEQAQKFLDEQERAFAAEIDGQPATQPSGGKAKKVKSSKSKAKGKKAIDTPETEAAAGADAVPPTRLSITVSCRALPPFMSWLAKCDPIAALYTRADPQAALLLQARTERLLNTHDPEWSTSLEVLLVGGSEEVLLKVFDAAPDEELHDLEMAGSASVPADRLLSAALSDPPSTLQLPLFNPSQLPLGKALVILQPRFMDVGPSREVLVQTEADPLAVPSEELQGEDHVEHHPHPHQADSHANVDPLDLPVDMPPDSQPVSHRSVHVDPLELSPDPLAPQSARDPLDLEPGGGADDEYGTDEFEADAPPAAEAVTTAPAHDSTPAVGAGGEDDEYGDDFENHDNSGAAAAPEASAAAPNPEPVPAESDPLELEAGGGDDDYANDFDDDGPPIG